MDFYSSLIQIFPNRSKIISKGFEFRRNRQSFIEYTYIIYLQFFYQSYFFHKQFQLITKLQKKSFLRKCISTKEKNSTTRTNMFEHVNTYFDSEKVSENWNNPEWNTRISRSNAVSILILWNETNTLLSIHVPLLNNNNPIYVLAYTYIYIF